MTDTLKFKLHEKVFIGEEVVIVQVNKNHKDLPYLIKYSDGCELWASESKLAKLQEKPMQNMQGFKLNETVKVLDNAKEITEKFGTSRFLTYDGIQGNTGVIRQSSSENICVIRIGEKDYILPFEALEKIPSEPAQAAEQIKLEVGRKYAIYYDAIKINIFAYLFESKAYYIFEADDGYIFSIGKSALNNYFIKKHSEPFKHSVTGYAVVCTDSKLHDVYITTYKHHADTYMRGCDKIIEGEVTFTEKSK